MSFVCERNQLMQPNRNQSVQYSLFKISGRTFAVEVNRVQEVVRHMPLTLLPLAPECVEGMINLRGQIATAISLPKLLKLSGLDTSEQLNVICKSDDCLLSFLVDEIGDVEEYSQSDLEATPLTLDLSIRRFMKGVIKNEKLLVSVLDVDLIIQHLNKAA
ncbi:MAG: purine-binding chemotaxis protein CheW [Proteobacteria bacterium]|nr:MAG: purine-binding chemotaxis protein CheW [Pseudomonadota bacterium]